MLHDIGKLNYKAGGERKTHSRLGADFLSAFCEDTEAGQAILRCVRYHHAKYLSSAHLMDNDLAYLVCEADNIAAGADRREAVDNGEIFGFDSRLSLENVFNVFEGTKKW